MSKKETVYLKGGANEVTLKSGDTGLYLDINLDNLDELLDNQPELVRETPDNRRSIRVFVTPSKKDRGYYKYYLTVAEDNSAIDWKKS